MQYSIPEIDEAALDRMSHATWARLWNSVSPESALLAWTDWASHLSLSPGRWLALAKLARQNELELGEMIHLAAMGKPAISEAEAAASAGDRRFGDPDWNTWPFCLYRKAFLQAQGWWDTATHDVWGAEHHHLKLVAFGARQWLDLWSPGNQWLTNPVVQRRTREDAGANLMHGFVNFWDDFSRQIQNLPPAGAENFTVGETVAVTPGKVVMRNALAELIQYTPTTPQVHAEPIMIVPAWIMKYYILDLSPHDSLIRYLVSQGHTVFCVSWRNPGEENRDMGMDDYLRMGLRDALDTVGGILPERKIHLAGYCLGGTLAAIGAAAMARDGDDRLASLTLLAAQTDFSEPGELGLFIDESQVSLLEAQMDQAGYLRSDQMSGAFQMLRPYDLLWSRVVNDYLMSQRRPYNDLMAWNADATRMPARMHSEYLRRLFLRNDLSQDRYPVDGKPISLNALQMPIFAVGTASDHVAPWRSVYKIHHLSPAEITFVLTSGGHNAGIVSEPGHPRRSYHIARREAGTVAPHVDAWTASADQCEGSWWPAWSTWLKTRSTTTVPAPRQAGAPRRGFPALGDAPGQYVLMP